MRVLHGTASGRRATSRLVAEFVERMRYVPVLTAGRNKFDLRWKQNMWLGAALETGESIAGTNEGTIKARDFRRTPEN